MGVSFRVPCSSPRPSASGSVSSRGNEKLPNLGAHDLVWDCDCDCELPSIRVKSSMWFESDSGKVRAFFVSRGEGELTSFVKTALDD